jgi:hypothetical protein
MIFGWWIYGEDEGRDIAHHRIPFICGESPDDDGSILVIFG